MAPLPETSDSTEDMPDDSTAAQLRARIKQARKHCRYVLAACCTREEGAARLAEFVRDPASAAVDGCGVCGEGLSELTWEQRRACALYAIKHRRSL
ncbi:hypothetical protein MN608_09956 [Microdochium nivale]|nr:hypothetical protein MN608_09956 [Microdochium nivale]